VAREGEEPHLPGLAMDHKQLFFLNFAQVTSNKTKENPYYRYGKYDLCIIFEYISLCSLKLDFQDFPGRKNSFLFRM